MSDNPLLKNLRIPGETHRMPSQGLFYTNGELDASVKDGEVHIYPMTAIDEITISSPDKLFSGDAIVEVFGRCIPQILNAKQLLAKDIDFLMVCLRKISYSDNFNIMHKHNCKDATKHEYPISMNSFISKVRRIDPTSITSNFSVVLDNGQTVIMEPVRYEDYINLMQKNSTLDNTDEKVLEYTLLSLVSLIKSVDGIEDKEQIIEWLSTIPVSWSLKISKQIENVTAWGIDFGVNAECEDCGQQIKLDVPINPISFFI